MHIRHLADLHARRWWPVRDRAHRDQTPKIAFRPRQARLRVDFSLYFPEILHITKMAPRSLWGNPPALRLASYSPKLSARGTSRTGPRGTFHKLFTGLGASLAATAERLETSGWTLKKKGYGNDKFNIRKGGKKAW